MINTKEEMIPRQIGKGQIIYKEKDLVNQIAMLVKGRIKAVGRWGEIEIVNGSFVGVIDSVNGAYLYTYTAEEDCVLFTYNYDETSSLERLLDEKNSGNLIASMLKQTTQLAENLTALKKLSQDIYHFAKSEYEGYQKLCMGYLMEPASLSVIEELKPYEEDDGVDETEQEFQAHLSRIPLDIMKEFYGASKYIAMAQVNNIMDFNASMQESFEHVISYINHVSKYLISKGENCLFAKLADMACVINEQKGDFNLILGKIKRIMDFINQADCISKNDIPVIFGHFKVRLQSGESVPTGQAALTQDYTVEQIQEVKELLKGAADKLISYSGLEKEKGDRLKQLLTVFGSFKDKFASTDDVTRVRKEITKLYYELYELVFLKTLDDSSKNLLVDLFLDYGFIDEKLVEEKQLLELAFCKKENNTDVFSIFTIREWLLEIYHGKAEPSKNEFDLDYVAVLREMKKTKSISDSFVKEYMADQKGKVVFELRNMFQSANKVTNGKVLTFCPILHKEVLSDQMEKVIVQKSAVKNAFEELRNIDYSLFYRNVLFHDAKHGIEREFIDKEVLPIIILMPNMGTQGSMWQETSGAKKDTPARIALPIMTMGDISDMVIDLAGKYRWEICKNIQGVYWSDITEKSLTSEYYDYLQFYRKNRDLTTVAKDKIKTSILKARNNFREVFVQDYIQWIRYESEGATRLNKVARDILLTYCPFNKEIRQKLVKYPAFADSLGRFEIHKAAKVKKIENSHLAIVRNGGTVTSELEENLEFNKR